jgi:hypothetical protein
MVKKKKRPAPKDVRGRRLVYLGRPPVLPDPDDDEAWENNPELTAWAEQVVAAARAAIPQGSPAAEEETKSRPAAGEEDSPRPDRPWTPPTDEELAEMAKITSEDIERAARRWQRSVDPQYANLLFAEPLTDELRRKFAQRTSDQSEQTGAEAGLEEE